MYLVMQIHVNRFLCIKTYSASLFQIKPQMYFKMNKKGAIYYGYD